MDQPKSEFVDIDLNDIDTGLSQSTLSPQADSSSYDLTLYFTRHAESIANYAAPGGPHDTVGAHPLRPLGL